MLRVSDTGSNLDLDHISIADNPDCISAIEIWSRSIFEPVSETLSNFHVWGFPTYVLEPKFQKPGVKIPK